MKTREIRSNEPVNESRRRRIGWALGAFAATAVAVGANFFTATHSFASDSAKAKQISHANAPLRSAAIAKPAPEASNAAAAVIVPTLEAANPFNAQNLEVAGGVGGFGAAGLGFLYAAARRSRRTDQAAANAERHAELWYPEPASVEQPVQQEEPIKTDLFGFPTTIEDLLKAYPQNEPRADVDALADSLFELGNSFAPNANKIDTLNQYGQQVVSLVA